MSLIQQLKREGVLEFWNHPKRTFQDISGNGIAVTNVGTNFTGNGLQFKGDASGDILEAGDVIDIASGGITLFAFVKHHSIAGIQSLISKGTAGTTQNYNLRINAGIVQLLFRNAADSGNRLMASDSAVVVAGQETLVSLTHTFGSTADSAVYINGASTPADDPGTDLPLENNLALSIGARNDGDQTLVGTMLDAGIVSRVLTADENLQLYTEMVELKRQFDSRPYEISGGTKFVQRDGIYESVATVGADSMLENSGWKNGTATTKIVHEIVDGKLRPVIECVTAGTVYIPTSRLHQTAAQAASGSFRFAVSKALDVSRTDILIIAETTDANPDVAQNGYFIRLSPTEVFSLFKTTAGSLLSLMGTGTGFITIGQTYVIDVIQLANEFTVSVDGVLLSPSTGSNPVTDATHTTSNFIVVDFDAGDKVCGFTKDIA